MCGERAGKVDLRAHDVILAVCELDNVVLALVHQREEVGEERRLVHAPNGVTLVTVAEQAVERDNVLLGERGRLAYGNLVGAVGVRAARALTGSLNAAGLICTRAGENVLFNAAGDGLGDNLDDIALERGKRHLGASAGGFDELHDFVAGQRDGAEGVARGGNGGVLGVESGLVVRTLDCELEIAGDVENLASLQNRRDLVHFLDNLVSGRLRDNGEAGAGRGRISALFVVGQRLTLQGLEPCRTIEHVGVLRRGLVGGTADGISEASGRGRSRAAVEHTLDSLSLFELLVLLVELAELFLDVVHVELVLGVALNELTDFSFAGGDFCASLFDVHNLPPKMIVVVWSVSMSKLRVSSASGLAPKPQAPSSAPPRKSSEPK